jgi:uncharacterized protein
LTGAPDFVKYPCMFRLLFIAFVLYVIFAAVRFIQTIGRPPGERRRPPTLGGTMVKDECCDMYLPREEAIREVRGGKEYFFCSRECRDGFAKRAEAERPPRPPDA